jgi:hypothetical protein
MKILGNLGSRLEDVGDKFNLEVFGSEVQPMIDESLKENEKYVQRKSKLSPVLTVWTVLGLALRREISCKNVLSWLLSGLRCRGLEIARDPVADGAIPHARKRIGVGVFRSLFYCSRDKACDVPADFHGWRSMAIDGTGMTMPDTPKNVARFGRPGTGRGRAAFPQTRVVALVATAVHAIYDIGFGPFVGKGTGERTLAMKLIVKNACDGLLFLLDKGFYGFDLLDAVLQRTAGFIVAVPDHVNLKPIRGSRKPDGSYMAWLMGEVEDPAGSGSEGRKCWKKVKHKVRVIEYQIPGFRRRRIATSLLDLAISACEIVKHYHRRWEIELAYDEIKTHQCARRKGQCQTVLRSKLPELVEQEIYAMVTAYNLLRDVINEAARKHGLDPLSISFVDALQTVLDAIPLMRSAPAHRLPDLYRQLFDDIADCSMKCWRRPRAYPRVVKVKMSNFELKKPQNVGGYCNFEHELRILGATA